jgi:glutamyl-tRNA synthetase
MIVTRVAPSPTGNGIVHIGTLRQIYHNWLFARANKGKFIYRIDDTDLKRSDKEIVDKLYEAIDWLGLDYDETFKQSDRFDKYTKIAENLVKEGLAVHDDGCIRMSGLALDCSWTDEITGDKEDNDQIRDFSSTQVIIKSDGSPVYNFCSAVDDIESGVTDVIRGTDHISNTYKQAYIYRALGKHLPRYHHVGLICHNTGKKLSKRDSDAMDLSGVNKDAILNYILRLGWSPKEDNKANNIIDKEKALRLFIEHGNLKASNAKIDLNKLKFYEKYYNRK